MSAVPANVSGLTGSRRARMGDPTFAVLVYGSGIGVLLILAAMVGFTANDSAPIFAKEGFGVFFGTEWRLGHGSQSPPIEGSYQGGRFLYGTVLTAVLAMAIAVPFAIGIALFLTQLAPRRIRTPLTYTVDLLAAVPSIVYGLWGSLFLVPLLLPVYTWISETFGDTIPFLAGPVFVRNLMSASIVLAIMVLPITSAVIREVFATVPDAERQAAFGLGATRWEVMRHVVLPRSRPGIIGASMLGLGRALGETIAVLLIIGAMPTFGFYPFRQNQTVAAQIASTFGEVAGTEGALGLTALGVALFVLTIAVNMIARFIVSRMGTISGDAAL